MKAPYSVHIGLLLLFIISTGCSPISGPLTPTEEPTTSGGSLNLTSSPRAITGYIPDSGWTEVKAGLERRVINLLSEEGQLNESIYLLRVDPSRYQFDIRYAPEDPKALSSWLTESGTAIAMNGGFFTENNETTALLISDGVSYGVSYNGFGGMLTVDLIGPQIRWLVQEPYQPSENLTAALQSFPMLITQGSKIEFSETGVVKARRSVIGVDSQGRFILLVAGLGWFSLGELQDYLADSDLKLESALNLDGGASSGLLLAELDEGVQSFSLLPIVILVYEK